MININNLHKSFDNNIVLDGLNLEIEKGSSSVIIGGSGTGKSVLIKCILGLIVPESGKIEINDKTIFDKGNYIHSNKTKIGMLFQGGALFDSLKIWQNVSFYHIQKGQKKIMNCMAR